MFLIFYLMRPNVLPLDDIGLINGIKGAEQFMPADMKDAPELVVPKELEASGEFLKPCAPEVTELYSKIWTEVLK